MAMPQPDLIENPIKLSKFMRNIININSPADLQLQRNKLVSFWAFLFSIFMYISIFYMFNLSPYTLVSTTNFWFFISNTLILIIAVDFNFGSFSNSSSSHDDEEYLFQEYMKNCQQKSTINSIEKKEIVNTHHEEEEESIKDVVLVEKNKQDEEEGGGILNVIDHKNNEVDQEDEKKKKDKLLGRSNSELKAIITVETKEKKNIVNGIQRSKSERYHDLQVNGDEEVNIDDEFSDMSVEELNRRVEEFIQTFNRQIRLQAVARNPASKLRGTLSP